jgi:hypothetical protein
MIGNTPEIWTPAVTDFIAKIIDNILLIIKKVFWSKYDDERNYYLFGLVWNYKFSNHYQNKNWLYQNVKILPNLIFSIFANFS